MASTNRQWNVIYASPITLIVLFELESLVVGVLAIVLVKINILIAVIHNDNTDKSHQFVFWVWIYAIRVGIQQAADNKNKVIRIATVFFPRKPLLERISILSLNITI